MSGTRRPTAGARIQLRAEDLPNALRSIERELARRAELQGVPAFAGVQLQAPDGTTWLVQVTNAGALTTTKVLP